MEPIEICLLSFAFIFTGAVTGFICGRVLPETHMSHDSKEAVKMGWGIVATMSALVLSLLEVVRKFDLISQRAGDAA